jgi:hypothetical protein
MSSILVVVMVDKWWCCSEGPGAKAVDMERVMAELKGGGNDRERKLKEVGKVHVPDEPNVAFSFYLSLTQNWRRGWRLKGSGRWLKGYK